MGQTARDHNGFTPAMARAWEILYDGEWHSRSELMRKLDYMEEEDRMAFQVLMCKMRKVLKERALLLHCVLSPTAGFGYQVSRKLMPMEIG